MDSHDPNYDSEAMDSDVQLEPVSVQMTADEVKVGVFLSRLSVSYSLARVPVPILIPCAPCFDVLYPDSCFCSYICLHVPRASVTCCPLDTASD